MLQWHVYNQDINKHEIKPYNVFNHGGFIKGLNQMFKDIKKEGKKYLEEHGYGMDNYKWSTRDENKYNKYMESFVDEYLRKECGYYFWSKCECEVVITSWPTYITLGEYYRIDKELANYIKEYDKVPLALNVCPEIGEKIDIYDQLRLNWDAFKRYVLEHEKEIKKQYKEWNKK